MTSLRRADSRLSRCCLRVAIGLMLALPLAALAGVALIGVVPGKAAVFSVDGGNPKLVKIGQSWSGIRVIAVDKQFATVEIDGTQQRIALGQHHRSGTSASTDRQQAVLAADARGHFVVDGAVNGGGVRFILDTGATTVALPGADAVRLGIDYRKGRRGTIDTANGRATAWLVKLDTVKVGGIELSNVDAIVVEDGLSIALLGMTFLNRVEMKRDGATMTLIRRY